MEGTSLRWPGGAKLNGTFLVPKFEFSFVVPMEMGGA